MEYDLLEEQIESIQDMAWSNNIGSNEEQLEVRTEIIKLLKEKAKPSICPNCGCGGLNKTYDGYWCKMCKTEI